MGVIQPRSMETSKFPRFYVSLGKALVIAMVFLSGCNPPLQNSAEIAPSFELPNLEGRTVRLADFRNKVVLLNFWGTTCAPCIREIPWLADFQRKYGPKGFRVVAVSMYGEGPEELRPYVAKLGMEDLEVLIGNERVGTLFGAVAFPTTFIIDQEGRLSSKHQGLINRSEVETEFAALLNRGETPQDH